MLRSLVGSEMCIRDSGLTEASPVVSCNPIDDIRVDTVGPPFKVNEVKIADYGEILVKGENVMLGYWNNSEETNKVLKDGWLYTGDIGVFEKNYLKITDRKKDIIITAGGKNISPSELENQLKFSPFISDAVVIGDKRKFLSCLIMIDEENVVKHAQDNDIPFSNFESLCKSKDIVELIDNEVSSVNKKFANVEQIKKFSLIDTQLTAEDDELTPTMKLKRKFINEKYSSVIDQMYQSS